MNEELKKNFKYIGYSELLKILKNEEIDYIAYAMSPWQMHSLEAALSYLNKKNGYNLKGIILIWESRNSGYLIKEDFFSKNNNNIFYLINKKSFLMLILNCINSLKVYYNLSKYKTKNQIFYSIRPWGYTYEYVGFLYRGVKKKKIMFIELDEGLSTYIKDDTLYLKSFLKRKRTIKEKFKACIRYFESLIFNKSKIIENGFYFDARLLIKNENGKYMPNKEMTKYYRQSIDNYSKKNQIKVSCFTGNYVIINTQPDTNKYINNIIDCINYLKEKGYKIIIKLHPQEKYSYDFICNDRVIAYKEPFSQESILSVVKDKPKFIVGYYSTTLVTANILYGIKTFSLDDMVIGNELVDDVEKEIMIRFKDAFENIVDFCSKFEEIK